MSRVSIYKANVFLAILLLFSFSGCVSIEKRPDSAEVELDVEEAAGETIRVEVLAVVESVELEGGKLNGKVRVEAAPYGRMVVDGAQWYGTYKASSGKGKGKELIYVNGRAYGGKVEVEAVGNSLSVINELPLERYLVGLINKEISSSWHEDVIKTQAVIARTYALFQKEKRKGEAFHLSSTHIDQVYGGTEGEDHVAMRAVRETKGEVLTHDGALALTVYHSNAGGRTDAAKDIWGGDYPYLVSVKSPEDRRDPRFEWTYEIGARELGEKLRKKGHDVGTPKKVRVEEKLRSGRVKELFIKGEKGSLEVSGEDLRALLGYSNLRSTLFRVRKKGRSFVFSGKGSGHGVGLSQWGARGMAERGVSYRKILRHYYPGADIKTLY